MVQTVQVIALQQLQNQGKVLIGDMTGSEWLDLMWNHGSPLLFDGHSDEDNLFIDQMHRAEYLVVEMLRRGLKKLRTMDGHGRFLTCFLKALLNAGEDVDAYEIEIYDIDPTANAWHKMFFPDNVLVANENILKEYDGADDTMVYLNFCSIGRQVTQLDEYLKTMFKDIGTISIMLSFSIRGATRFGEVGSFITLVPQKYVWNYYCNRRNFFSGLICGLKDSLVSKKRVHIDVPSVAIPDDLLSEMNESSEEEEGEDESFQEEVVCAPKARKSRRVVTDDE